MSIHVLLAVALLAAIIIPGCVWLANRITRGKVAFWTEQAYDRLKYPGAVCLANGYTSSPSADIGTHNGQMPCWVQTAVSQRYLLYSLGASNVATVLATGATMPHGTIADETMATEVDATNGYYQGAGVSGAEKALQILGNGPTKIMVAGAGYTPAIGDEAFASAGGYIQKRPTGSGTYWKVGVILDISMDGGLCEVADCPAAKLVV